MTYRAMLKTSKKIPIVVNHPEAQDHKKQLVVSFIKFWQAENPSGKAEMETRTGLFFSFLY